MKEWRKLISLNLVLILLLGVVGPLAAYAAEDGIGNAAGETAGIDVPQTSFQAYALATGEACIDPAVLDTEVPKGSVLFSNGAVLPLELTPMELGLEYEVVFDSFQGTYSWSVTGTSDWVEANSREIMYVAQDPVEESVWTLDGKEFRLDNQANSLLLIQEQSCELQQFDSAAMLASALKNQISEKRSDQIRMIDKDGDGDADYVICIKPEYAKVDGLAEHKTYGRFVFASTPSGRRFRVYEVDMTNVKDLPQIGDVIKVSWDFSKKRYQAQSLQQEKNIRYNGCCYLSRGVYSYSFADSDYYIASSGWTERCEKYLDEEYLFENLNITTDGDLLVLVERTGKNYTDIAEVNAQLALIMDARDSYSSSTAQDSCGIKFMTVDGNVEIAMYLNKPGYVQFSDIFPLKGADQPKYGNLSDQENTENRLFILHKSDGKVYLEALNHDEVNEQLQVSETLLETYQSLSDCELISNAGEVSITEESKKSVISLAEDERFFFRCRNRQGSVQYSVMTPAEMPSGTDANAYAQLLQQDRQTAIAGYASFDFNGKTTSEIEAYMFVLDNNNNGMISVIDSEGKTNDIAVTNKKEDIRVSGLYSATYQILEDYYTLTPVVTAAAVDHDRTILDYVDDAVLVGNGDQTEEIVLEKEAIAASRFVFDYATPEGALTLTEEAGSFISLDELRELIEQSDKFAFDYIYRPGELFYAIAYQVGEGGSSAEKPTRAELFQMVFGNLPEEPTEPESSIHWTLENGVLTLTGRGPMDEYQNQTAPWESQKDAIRSIHIGEGITTVSSGAFSGCQNLQAVQLPETLTGLGEDAFMGCYSLESIAIPGSVSKIGRRAFFNCNDLYQVEIAEGVECIGAYAFSGCKNLGKIKLPESITQIAAWAFFRCGMLTEIELPKALEILGNSAFSGCGTLRNVWAGENLNTIGKNAFHNTSKELVLHGPVGSEILRYAKRNNINCEYDYGQSIILTAMPNIGYPIFSRSFPGVAGNCIAMGIVADAMQRELNFYTSDADLVSWNTAADGSGDGYARDVRWTLTEDITLYAQWKTPEWTIGGEGFPITESRQGTGWYYDADHRTLTIQNYRGGGITYPGSLVLEVTGSCNTSAVEARAGLSVHVQAGAALEMTKLTANSTEICCEKGSMLTITNSDGMPAISASRVSFSGEGMVRITSSGATAMKCSGMNAAPECRLTISAQHSAVSGQVRLTRGSKVYLVAGAAQPAAYRRGPYLQIEPQIWTIELRANGGSWAGQQGSIRSFPLYYGGSIDLGEQSDALSREGYRLMGWQDAEDRKEYPLRQVASAADLTLYAVWAKRELRIDGGAYPIDQDHSGTGWSYHHPAGDKTTGLLEIFSGYSGKPVYCSEDLDITFSGVQTITGFTGEPAIWSLGSLKLQQSSGSLTLRGGEGECAVKSNGALLICSGDQLVAQGGSGGIGFLAGTELWIENAGAVTVSGGMNGNAVAAKRVTITGTGKTILVGAGVPMASAGDLVLDEGLKYYAGKNAGDAVRSGNLKRASYLRVQPRTILVTLYANGGTVCGQEVYSREYLPAEQGQIVLQGAQGAFGAVFTGWNTRINGDGVSYPVGEQLMIDGSVEELRLFAQYRYQDSVKFEYGKVLISFVETIPQRTQRILLAGYDSKTGQMVACASGNIEAGSTKSASFQTERITADMQLRVFFLDQDNKPLGPARTITQK